jgi:hypothetical protein
MITELLKDIKQHRIIWTQEYGNNIIQTNESEFKFHNYYKYGIKLFLLTDTNFES